MSLQRLLYYIGAFIFGGLGILSFLQIDHASERPSAWVFIALSAIVYFALVTFYFKNQKLFLMCLFTLAIIAVAGTFSVDLLFQKSH